MGEVGSRKTRIDGKGDTTTYTYDNVNRNTLVDYPSGTDTTFTYDALGRRTVMEDGVGLTTWVYDAIGRLTEVDDPNTNVVTYSYDVRSRKSSMGLSGVGLTTYSYDSRGRLRLIDNPYAETTTYSYDALSRPSRQDNDNGAYTTFRLRSRQAYAYNNAGWMTGVSNKKSDASVISSFAYNYDNVGNRTWVTEGNGDKVTWSYDNSYQLTRERRDGDNAYDVTYTYDAVGNRATKLSGGTTTSYTYDSANKMTVTNDGTTLTTFTYDSNGNQLAKTVPGGNITTYSYNYENKMTGITYADASLNTFAYDGDGKRLQKQDSSGTLRLVYDHQGPTGLYDLAKETDGSNNLVAFYTQGPMLISQRRGGNGYCYHDDAVGSTSAITSSNETTTSTYKYYAFGEVLTSSGTLANPFKYVGGLGYYTDPDTGLLLLRARYYWPSVGRFLGRDPVRAALNRYGYGRNGPTVGVDPSGRATCHAVKIWEEEMDPAWMMHDPPIWYDYPEGGSPNQVHARIWGRIFIKMKIKCDKPTDPSEVLNQCKMAQWKRGELRACGKRIENECFDVDTRDEVLDEEGNRVPLGMNRLEKEDACNYVGVTWDAPGFHTEPAVYFDICTDGAPEAEFDRYYRTCGGCSPQGTVLNQICTYWGIYIELNWTGPGANDAVWENYFRHRG